MAANHTPSGDQLSAQAHAQSEQGRLKKREAVFDILLKKGPMTAHELALCMDRDEGRNVYARLSELEAELRAKRDGVRVNAKTGKKAALWHAVKPGEPVPEPRPKKVPRKALEAENIMLKNQVQELVNQIASQKSVIGHPL